MEFETRIGKSTKESIEVHGYDLAEQLIGNITLADMAFLGAKHRKPSEEESQMLNALLIAICEHGFTPSSISARLTYLGAPEAVQAAVAAGLLGAGTVYFGAMEYVSEMLQNAFRQHGEEKSIEELAATVIKERKEQGLQLPGFGHHIHKPVDPRTPKLFALAEELGFLRKHSKLLLEMHKQFCEEKGKQITLNVTGAIGAIMSDMEIDYRLVKSFAVAARAVGLVGHIAEEIEKGRQESVAQQLFEYVENHTDYRS
ncbi:citryl-CoA lyase [Alkalihalobacillus oceani]|uniref:citrate synthase (unknown stereospecificity) n=1 Tax=Halalkalibacter oceani TaxID=1653776 RepID=A0A9X2DM96_9BACI|nr:citryl-CoA lyase [Halalkalibacter oceani]MCM3713364.1 citryl-CoA lyase [Halalkalibacter oceani]